MNETIKTLETRRSVRCFDAERMPSEEMIKQIVEAGEYAPTGRGKQSPRIVVVTNERPTYIYDGSLVMGNLMNAARSLGLGSCWIHRAKEIFDSEEGKALLKEWGIEGDYEGIGHVALGYAKGDVREAMPRKEDYAVWVR